MLFWIARWSLHLSIDVVGTDPDTALPGRPEIVVSRHAGPGDSFILIHALVNWFAREPRIVLKATLQWDPAVDVLLNRLPNRFISPGRTGTAPLEQEIGELATGLDDNDAFVIFPEGGNFTPRRRIRAIARLRDRGLGDLAVRAREPAQPAAAETGRPARRDRRGAGRRGHLRGAHRAGPDAHGRATSGVSCRWTSSW